MMSVIGRHLSRARRSNQILADERLQVIRLREEHLRLRQGVRRFKLGRPYRCGKATDLVVAQLLLQINGEDLTDAQRKFRTQGLLHVGLIGMRPCRSCMQLFRLYDLYRTWWREGVMLEEWERVSTLDPDRMWRSEILQVANILQRRLDYVRAVETQYDPESGKLHY